MENNKYYSEACEYIKKKILKDKNVSDVLLKGSMNIKTDKKIYWSDIDMSLIVNKPSIKIYTNLSKCFQEFKKRYPKIKLSLTLINKNDNPSINCLHHHGIKPISFNFELQDQTKNKFFSKNIKKPCNEAIILSSIYRYYEILYEFRKDIIQNKLSDREFVGKYFHRASRFIRTQFEILEPEFVKEKGIIDEENFINYFEYQGKVRDFFKIKKKSKKNWLKIIKNKKNLNKMKKYLINFIDNLNNQFIPKLIKISKNFEDDNIN